MTTHIGKRKDGAARFVIELVAVAATTMLGTPIALAQTPPPAGMPQPRHAAMLDDSKILYVTHVANSGEIDQGKLAKSRAKDPRVKHFADMMIAHHTDADRKGTALAQKEKLDLTPSAIGDQLKKEGSENLKQLTSASDADFDRTYIDAQVKGHEEVLTLIDQQLLPNAKDASVQTLLRDIRPTVANHLEQARSLQKGLEK